MGANASKHVDYLKGPVSLTFYKNPKTGKEIYIFGDLHVYDPKCKDDKKADVDVVKFIENTLKSNPDKTIDLFIESPMKTADYQIAGSKWLKWLQSYQTGYIAAIQSHFWGCETFEKNCPYNNLRYHYIDWRLNPGVKTNQYRLYSDIMNIGPSLILSDQIKWVMIDVTYNDFIGSKTMLMDGDFTLNSILKNLKIDKQLANIKDKKTRDKIYKYIQNTYKNTIIKPSKFFDTIIQYKKEWKKLSSKYNIKATDTKAVKANPEIMKLINNINKFAIQASKSTYMIQDAYALTRMFRSFKNAPEIQYVFLYVGAHHMAFYDAILTKELGFNRINTSKDSLWTKVEHETDPMTLQTLLSTSSKKLDSKQCLYIGDFKQPFFV